MKKILYVSANGFIGGAESFLLNLAKMHADNKDNVHFLLFRKGVFRKRVEKTQLCLSLFFKINLNFLSLCSYIKQFEKFAIF